MIINVHSHSEDKSDGNLLITSYDYSSFKEPKGYFSIGAHPWISLYHAQIEKLAQLPRCLAIGECGLDRVKGLPFKEQLSSFEAQILVAEKFQKPLIIHCVKAFDALLRFKKNLNPSQPWIIHGYQKNIGLAIQLVNAGCFLSIGSSIKKDSMKEVVRNIPSDFLFLETDESSISIKTIYTIVAETLHISLEELETIISRNFNTVFKKDASELVRKNRVTYPKIRT